MRSAEFFLIGILCLCWVGCSKQPGLGSDPLKVGMELSYPPFEMTDEGNEPAGVSVDLAKELGDYLGREVEIQNTPFDGLIPALRTGKIDCIISSMTRTPERAKVVSFSNPYLTTGLCLLIPKDSGIEAVEDLNEEGRKVAVKKGTTGHLYAEKELPSAKLFLFDKETTAVIEVTQGKVDAFIYDQMSTYRNWKRHEDTTKPLLSPFQSEQWAVAVRKGDDDLINQINLFLLNFEANRGFEKLGDRYFKEQKDAFKAMGIPFVF